MAQEILGYFVVDRSAGDCIKDISASLDGAGTGSRWLCCLNPHSYALAKNDRHFDKALKAADWLIPDGIGIVLAGIFLGRRVHQRITGFDIFQGVMDDLERRRGRVFFLGSTEETLNAIVAALSSDYPNIEIAGVYSPPYKAEFNSTDTDRMLAAISEADPDVLWVGMTAPKQEKWIADNIENLNVQFIGAIGAVFDFYSGQVGRSHPTFQKLGLEWLPRLLKQPRRLWRRMGISAPIFLWDVALRRIGCAN